MSWKILITSIALLLSVNANAAWVDLGSSTPVAPVVEVVSSGAYGLTLHVLIQGFESENVVCEGDTYQYIQLSETFSKNTEGHPDVPYLYKLINLSEEGDIAMSLQTQDSVVLNGYYVYPSARQVVEAVGDSTQVCRK